MIELTPQSVGFAIICFGFVADRLWGPLSQRVKQLESNEHGGPLAQRVKQLEERSNSYDLVHQKLGIQFETLEKAITKLDQSINHLSTK